MVPGTAEMRQAQSEAWRYHRQVASRVLIYGVTGSGKTTLARHVARRTGLPWHSVDDLTWEPGWIGVPAEEQRRRVGAICAGESWILDSGYSQWIDVVLARVELIVALDYPRWRSLARLVRRTLGRAIDRRTICNGNTESLRQIVARDSIIVWHFRSFARKRARMRAWAADPAAPEVVLLASPAATRRWLASLQPAGTFAAPGQ
jgi:adenylate kinase family enzyme